MQPDPLAHLQLQHLADSALPIGSVAHSFGLEALVAEGFLTTNQLEPFLLAYLGETGVVESCFCRVAYRMGIGIQDDTFEREWTTLNLQLSALKVAREGRTASATLGRRFLQLVLALEALSVLWRALHAAAEDGAEIHIATAFGLVGGALHLGEEATLLAYLQQSTFGLISACQRLLPLGQIQASGILWRLKPAILNAVAASRVDDPINEAAFSFTPLVDIGGMRHPALSPRLFIS
jgi:urease accessory protein